MVGFTAGAAALVYGVVELGKQVGQGGAAWRCAVLSAVLGVATLHGAFWHGRRTRERGPLRRLSHFEQEQRKMCGAVDTAWRHVKVASASSTEGTRAAAPWAAWRGASGTPP